MSDLVDWNWFIGRRRVDISVLFKNNGVENYDQVIALASRMGLTTPECKEVERFLTGANVVQGNSNNISTNDSIDVISDSLGSDKSRKRRKKIPTTEGSIEATEALEKSEKNKKPSRKTRQKKSTKK